jgi:hypothetical protein
MVQALEVRHKTPIYSIPASPVRRVPLLFEIQQPALLHRTSADFVFKVTHWCSNIFEKACSVTLQRPTLQSESELYGRTLKMSFTCRNKTRACKRGFVNASFPN